jgi:alanyl-tRNA synthetase
MTSAQIRQSFLDFFSSKGHTITPSSPLLPDSPGLLFTNAGMNQFVPIFLGDRAPDVSKWAGVRPAKDTRAADTQKCIRAGGKHNDLEDVGFDTYHHTMFEMLGNWSFGDYFKQESINWGWELITKVWGIPPKRLFATIYQPDKSKGDPADRDEEAYQIWAKIFTAAGLDPAVHIVNGNKKDNFWMMGDTGPCGPCSEIHFNLLPSDDEAEGRKLVNASSPRCIEIWNHVFIQFNANADGTFAPLAAKHVDTGMGFERVAGIYATTNGFKDFTKDPSNYAADVFAPLFKKIAELSGKTYTAKVPEKREGLTEQEKVDIAFRVLADHARCVCCAIADGIMPGNKKRNSVVRQILRRGVLYGHKDLNLTTSFFHELAAPVIVSLGEVFPELIQQRTTIERIIRSEEENFRRTLDRGLLLFRSAVMDTRPFPSSSGSNYEEVLGKGVYQQGVGDTVRTYPKSENRKPTIYGSFAFLLYATYGFPLEMTQLLATENGLTVDVDGFNAEMAKHKEISDQAEQEIIVAATEGDAPTDQKPTAFLGYTQTSAHAKLIEVVKGDKATFLVFDQTPFYAEMGGQAGDAGHALINDVSYEIVDTVKDKSGRHLHKLSSDFTPPSSPSPFRAPRPSASPSPAATPSRATTAPRTCSTGRLEKSSARTSGRPAHTRRPSGCASTSPTSRPSRTRSFWRSSGSSTSA